MPRDLNSEIANNLNKLLEKPECKWADANTYFTVPSSGIEEECRFLDSQADIEVLNPRNESPIDPENLPQKLMVLTSSYESVPSTYTLFTSFIRKNSFDETVFHKVFFDVSKGRYFYKDFEKIGLFESVASILVFLQKVADFDDRKNLVFWAQGKLTLPITLSKEFFEVSDIILDKERIGKFFLDVFNETCENSGCSNQQLNKERISILKAVIKRMLDDVEDSKKLETLLQKFDLLESNWRQDYDAYIHDLDFDEIRQKVREQIEKTHLSVGKVLSENHLKIIGLPLAIAFVLSKVKEGTSSEILGVYIFASLVMLLFSFLIYRSQKEDLRAIDSSFSMWKEWLKSYPIHKEYLPKINELEKRIDSQKNLVLTFMLVTLLFGLGSLVYIFSILG